MINPQGERPAMPEESALLPRIEGLANPVVRGGTGSQDMEAALVSTPVDDNGADSALDDASRLARTERLIDEHHEAVFRYAYRLTGCSASAEDIAQEVYLRVFRSIHQLRDEQAAKGWLMVIVRNEFTRWYKKLRPSTSLDQDSFPQEQIGVSDPTEIVVRCDWIQEAMQQLAPEYRTVIGMYYFEELTYAQIAEQLQIPIGTVMSRLSRSKKSLREELDKAELQEQNRINRQPCENSSD